MVNPRFKLEKYNNVFYKKEKWHLRRIISLKPYIYVSAVMLNNNCDRRVMTKDLMRRDLEKMGFPNPPLDNFKEYEHGEYFMRGLYPYPYEVIIETRQGYATLGRFKHRTQAERLFRKILKLFK